MKRSYVEVIYFALLINSIQSVIHRRYNIINKRRSMQSRFINQDVNIVTERVSTVDFDELPETIIVTDDQLTMETTTVDQTKATIVTKKKASIRRKTPSRIIKILLWIPTKQLDSATREAFVPGYKMFRQQKCFYDNCYLVRSYVRRRTIQDDEYEAVMFFGRYLSAMATSDLPSTRSLNQRYIYLQLESNDMYPVCQKYYDDFFNWTVTYKLDSDIPWPHFTVKNLWNRTVGPRTVMNWNKIYEDSNTPIKLDLKLELRRKCKLVAWFKSNCKDKSARMEFVVKFKKELERHNHTLDVFGRCGSIKCPEGPPYSCKRKVKEDYVFYLAMESSVGEDYITSKVLTAVQSNAIPIVYSHANYTRFLPPGSYLDALRLSPTELVRIMLDVYSNTQLHESYFKWRSLYTLESNYDHRAIACQLCEKLNIDRTVSRYERFREWWNKNYLQKCRAKYSQLLRRYYKVWPFY